jgi:enediyne biosynthesis protein E4
MLRQFTRRDFLNFAALAAAAPIFEVKPLRGIDFILQNSPTSQKFLIETMSGGAALLDYNNDGLLDIFLVNGGRITNSLHV